MILTLIEHDRGRLNDLTLQGVTLGRQIAEQLGVPLEALIVGADARPLADRLGEYGVTRVHVAEAPGLDDFAPAGWAQAAVDLIGRHNPRVVLTTGTDRGNEVMAHLAAKLDLPFAANILEARLGDSFEVTRARWGGSLLEEARVGGGATKLLSSNPHAVPAVAAATATTPTVETFAPTLSAADLAVKITSRVEADRSKISLADANVVVSGGRGVGSAEGFAVLEALAAQLGAAVGCSRAVTSLGWRPHSDQVGQTGTRIAPEIYITCGVSGAIQHMVGCKSAKTILAINNDPEATIVGLADYVVLGDLHQVVPAITQALKSRKG